MLFFVDIEFFTESSFLTSAYGGEWLRPDGGEISCMPRTPVGLANHPATHFKWQLTVASGCLMSGPSCLTLPVGWVRASHSRLAEPVVRAGFGENAPK